MHQDLSWQRLIHNWSDAELRFALQATTDTAPTATNLRRWGVLEVDPACIMCGKPATLRHVLNGCPDALHQGRYTWRHNSVLSAIRHRLNTFWEQCSTQLAVQATVSTKEKARYIQFVRAGQRLPAPDHITQRKPLASQAILLQGNDWTFLYDLKGQLQFPIEAAVTSLRPDVVLFSRSSKAIVPLELTVPPEDNVHLAHDRKTTKYSALVTACEENGFKTHMFALEVGCLGYCPHATENLFSIDRLFYGTHSRTTYNHSRIVNHFAMLSRATTNHINLPQQKTFPYHSPLPFLNLQIVCTHIPDCVTSHATIFLQPLDGDPLDQGSSLLGNP